MSEEVSTTVSSDVSNVASSEPVSQDVTDNSVVNDSAEHTSIDTSTEAVQEKMIPQSQVNRIAAREAREAAARATADLRAQYERERIQTMQQSSSTQNSASSFGGMPQFSPEQLQQTIREQAYQIAREEKANQIAQDWHATMNAEKDADPQFEKLYDALNIESHPDLVLWVSGMDNKAAVVRDIASNPSKFSSILMLARSGSPELARMELNKLSASIKANTAAQKLAKSVAEPLTQVKSSSIHSDNGNMSVSDYRKMFRG